MPKSDKLKSYEPKLFIRNLDKKPCNNFMKIYYSIAKSKVSLFLLVILTLHMVSPLTLNGQEVRQSGSARDSTSRSNSSGTVRRNSLGIEFVYIPSGNFMMGSTETEVNEAFFWCKKYLESCVRETFSVEMPRHKVTIKDGFWMGKFEVTHEQWQSLMGSGSSNSSECGINCPVFGVSWNDIQIFLKRLNSGDDEFEYSLPTEAQWEYAARAGTTTAFSFGNTLNSSQANFDGDLPFNSATGIDLKRTVKVGSYKPNAFGLYDMHGNVWEWMQDIYNPGYQGLPSDGSANLSIGDSRLRTLRGGSWYNLASVLRSAARNGFPVTSRDFDFGFRLVAKLK